MAVQARKKTEKKLSELVQVRKKAQITLPQSVRKELGIEEGDFLDIRVENGEAVVKVKKLIDKDQAWFWTKRWQEGEREAEADIRAGRGHTFANAEEAIAYLDERARRFDEDKAAKKKKAAK
ncbi:MAG TPA: AbrB/MazE/SpoVT family DNA-binding domain-containing protein [Dehalococcoidia bacterium]|nr:MAG: AbrB family transcriptional regulator [Chloroflexi bacterium RBG_16_51_9]